MKRFSAPELRNDFIIVVHENRPEMACIALSYLFKTGKYIPVFSFPEVEVSLNDIVKEPDVYLIQRRRAEKFAVSLNNALVESGMCNNLIFLGLTNEQKSYLTFKEHLNVIDVYDSANIGGVLSAFCDRETEILECAAEQLFEGFCQAIQTNSILKIGSFNSSVNTLQPHNIFGFVAIEEEENSYTVVAINYALTVGCFVKLVKPIQKYDDDVVLNLIERWDKGDNSSFQNLKRMISERIGDIEFKKYAFATFFTRGLPYSLAVSDIPCSLVNLSCQPDFFIFSAIYSDKTAVGGVAAVFSPGFFKDEEETEGLIRTFESKNYYLRKLIGKRAQTADLRSTILHFPFDVLHICSHGGSVSGTRCSVTFHDKDKVEHVIEFDHVLGVTIYPGVEKHPIESYWYFRKLDGLIWRSKELKAKNYSNELYATMRQEIHNAFDENRVVRGERIYAVANTNAIACTSFNYHANFDQMGGQMLHPFIFNNSCWSWMKISTSFLYNGARGYIGTMRSIPNAEAVQFAENFYRLVFDNNIIDAFYFASAEHLGIKAEPNYIFWGLHFSVLSNERTPKENRSEVLRQLGKSYTLWNYKYLNKEGSKDILRSYIREIKDLCNEIIIENMPPSLFKGFPLQSNRIFKQVKIGRNEPCPCGSGKKYKNCNCNK